MNTKPTIEELEKILAGNERHTIRLNPDGSVFVNDELDKLQKRITTLLAVIEQCEKTLEAFMNEDNWHGKGKVAPKWLLNQGAEALAAIRALKEGK